MHFQQQPSNYNPQAQGHQHPTHGAVSPQRKSSRDYSQQQQQQQRGGISRGNDYGGGPYGGGGGGGSYDLSNSHSNESTRNYTDSQLGVAMGGLAPVAASSNPPSQQQQQHVFIASPPRSNYSNHRPTPKSSAQSSHHNQPLQQQYSTPRMPRHATVLKDRGSTENSEVRSIDPSSGVGGSENMMGYGYNNQQNHHRDRTNMHHHHSSPALKGRAGSHGKNLNKAAAGSISRSTTKIQSKEMRSPDGRHTPVRNHTTVEGQEHFATPNQRLEVPSTPTSIYSEPPRRRPGMNSNNRARIHPNMSPNFNRMRSPDHHQIYPNRGVNKHALNGTNGASRGNASNGPPGPAPYTKNQSMNNPNNSTKHQSKLPHGLTVQELKEMTRARLAAEGGEVRGPDGLSDQSVHSAGTHASSKGSTTDQFSLGRGSNLGVSGDSSSLSVTRNLVQSNDSVRRDAYSNQGLAGSREFQLSQQQQMQQNQYPNYPNQPHRYASPVFGAAPQNNQFNGSQVDTWESASSNGSGAAATMPYMSPISDSNAMTYNRGRCFSAGANTGIPAAPAFEHRPNQAYPYFDHAPLTGGTTANRERCATVSPPGMSRLHEDRPFLFATDDKERLAIPPLSEPRRRLHSTGGLTAGRSKSMRAFTANSRVGSISPPPNSNVVSGGSAFVPIAKSNEQFMPQSPPRVAVHRSKFEVGDRTISLGSAGHGDLPSSMAEAVLESITSTGGGAMGVIGAASLFGTTEPDMTVGKSPFRVAKNSSSQNTASAFRLDDILPEGPGSVSLFSRGDSGNIFSTENAGERTLLGTHSWGGMEDETAHSNNGLSHDFSNLLNLSGDDHGPALRGRAATEPVWFGGNDPLLVSRIDPEHTAESRKGPPRVSSLADTHAPSDFNMHGQSARKPEFR